MNSIEALGLLAGCFTTGSFVPQVYKIWKTRSARDLSWGMAGVFTVGTFFWLLYGLATGATSIIVANSITFGLSLAICVMKYRFDAQTVAHRIEQGAIK